MKLHEILGRRLMWPHQPAGSPSEHRLRINVSHEQRAAVVDAIKKILGLGDNGVLYTSRAHATSFPCEIRIWLPDEHTASEFNMDSESLRYAVMKAAIRQAFKEVLDIPVRAVHEKDVGYAGILQAHGYDFQVGWA